jgi:hypothetical protein
MNNSQKENISLISIMFDKWLSSLGDQYEQASEYLGHSILDIQEMLKKLQHLQLKWDLSDTKAILNALVLDGHSYTPTQLELIKELEKGCKVQFKIGDAVLFGTIDTIYCKTNEWSDSCNNVWTLDQIVKFIPN